MKKRNKKFESWHTARTTGLVLGVIFLILLIIVGSIAYFVTFTIVRPFDNMITQDRPLIEKLCLMQEGCGSGVGFYRCSYKGQLRETSVSKLSQWQGYQGCNESTKGYGTSGDFEYINVKSCGCGGFN